MKRLLSGSALPIKDSKRDTIMRIKMNAVAAATAMVLGTLSTAANANLVITEYVEGSSNNKALEISNVGSSSIDLDANTYKLNLYFNGKTTVGKT
ncbi:hypothetical protein ACVBKF_30935, partial [Shewanella sp. 0m-11]